MPKLKQHDLQLWNLFVEVCGGRCNACGKTRVLERGHIQPDTDGGAGTFDNLIPLCKSCNASYKGFTPDTRPEGWQDVFAKRFLSEFGLGLRLKTGGSAYLEPGQPKPGTNDLEVIQNKALLDWSQVEFVPSKLLCPTYEQADPPRPLTDSEATRLLNTTIQNARTYGLVKPPPAARKAKMTALVKGLRTDRFTLVAEEFLRQKPWDDYDRDPWSIMCDNPELYLEDARRRKRNEAAQIRRQRESHLAERWRRYLQAGTVPEWPDMTDADRVLIATAKGLVDQEPRAVNDADLEMAWAIVMRQVGYWDKQVRETRARLMKMGEMSVRILKLLNNPDPEFGQRIKSFCGDIATLKHADGNERYERYWRMLEQDLNEALDWQESNRAGVNDPDVLNDPDRDNNEW
jgi:hypothetical protein